METNPEQATNERVARILAYRPTVQRSPNRAHRRESPTILFLHGSDEPFGSDRVLLSVVELAAARGSRVHVLLPDDTADGWLTQQLVGRGVAVSKTELAPARRRYLSARSLPSYAVRLVRARRNVRREVGRVGADLVYVNTTALVVGALVGRPSRTRVIWHVHELVVAPVALAWLFRVLPMAAADEVVAISHAVAANLRRAHPRRARLHVVHNGVALVAASLERPATPRLVTFAGRLSRWKGYELFVDAAASVARRVPHVRFAVAGAPPAGEEWRVEALERRLAELGIVDQLEILGLQDDLSDLFDRSHVVVVPSTWPEPFGLVVVEAMRACCAVVASRHGAAEEIVEDGVSGVLVTPGDVEDLTRAISLLLDDEPLRRRLAAAARQRVADRFSDERFRTSIGHVIDEADRWRKGRLGC